MPLNPDELLGRFRALADQHGFEHQAVAAQIPAFSRISSGPLIQLSAGIHGDEPASPLAALTFLEKNPPSQFSWLLTPLLNPTGLALGTRENEHGIDLNRDYHRPESAEIKAHLAWLDQQPTPDLFISLHEDYDATGFYFYEIQIAGRPSIRQAVFDRVLPLLPLEPGPLIDGRESNGAGWFFKEELPNREEFVAEEGGYPEALYLSQKGCPLSLTFETPTHAAPLQTRIDAHLAAIWAALDEFRTF